jgi:hypothetical protein
MMTALSLRTDLSAKLKRMCLLLPALLLLLFSSLQAAPDKEKLLPADSAKMQVREPSKSTQDDFYKDDYWSFDREKNCVKEEPGVIDRILDRFLNKLARSFDGSADGGTGFWTYFWILVLIALVVFAILRLTNSGVSGLFSGKQKKEEDPDASLDDVDIHAIDYERMIAEALEKKDYRLGVRLWFLRTLKLLSDKELLSWKIDKTNSDYFYELSGSSLQDDFGKVSFVYDYIWYGEFPVDDNLYRDAEAKFRKFHQDISSKG